MWGKPAYSPGWFTLVQVTDAISLCSLQRLVVNPSVVNSGTSLTTEVSAFVPRKDKDLKWEYAREALRKLPKLFKW